MIQKNRFCILIPSFCIPIFAFASFRLEKEIEESGKRISFSSYSIDELVRKAKNDRQAKEEVFLRTKFDIIRYTEALCKKNSFLEFDIVYQTREKAIVQGIEKYEEARGPFRRLLRKMFYWAGKSLIKSQAIRYHQERRVLGTRIYNICQSNYRGDSHAKDDSLEKRARRKCDIENYRNGLSNEKRERRNRYFLGLSFKEIGKIQSKAVSTVSYQIYRILKERKKKIRKRR